MSIGGCLLGGSTSFSVPGLLSFRRSRGAEGSTHYNVPSTKTGHRMIEGAARASRIFDVPGLFFVHGISKAAAAVQTG